VYEWNVYDRGLDALITPLLFSFAGDSVRDALLRAGADPYVVLLRCRRCTRTLAQPA